MRRKNSARRSVLATLLFALACGGDDTSPDAAAPSCPSCEVDQICVQYQEPDCSTVTRCEAKPAGCEPDTGPGWGCSEACRPVCYQSSTQCENPPTVACGNELPGALICHGS